MLDVEVIEDPAGAVVALDPVRVRLLAEVAEPRSAAAFADELTRAVTTLVSKHHVADGSPHRLVAAHPIPKEPQ